MVIALAILSALLALSIALNGALTLHIRRTKKQKPESYELRQFVRDMLDRGLLEVRRIDPANVMLRSPKDTP